MDLVPADATFVAEFDLNELRELRDLRLTDQLYSDIRDEAEAAGMQISALDSHAGYGTAEESEILVYGFSPDGREGAFREFRFALEDRDIEEDAYLDYELWGSGEDSQSDAFAILEEDGYVIQASSGGVKEAIRTLDRGSGSLAEAGDEPLSQLWGKLPGGFLRYSWSECMVLTSCSGVGVSVTGMDASNGDAQVQAVLLFHSEQAANNAVTDYDELASVVGFLAGGSLDYDGDTSGIEEPTISEVKADGNFVVCDVVVSSKDGRSSELHSPEKVADSGGPPPPSAAEQAAQLMPAVPAPAAPTPAVPRRLTAIPIPQPAATPLPTPTAQPALPPTLSGPTTNTDTDRAALTALYHATDGPNWNYVTNWLTDAPLSEWYGVFVDNNGRVIQLELVQNGLTGTIPPELGDLSNLEEMFFQENNLPGTIPPELGNLSNLKKLVLYRNNLTGAVPPEFRNLSNLETLVLAENNLTGEIPEDLAALPLNLISFNENSGLCAPPSLRGWLEGIQFAGHICAHAEDMAALTALYHATEGPNWNNVTNWLTDAPLAEWHGVAVNNNGRVVGLDLRGNNLTGAIPPELGNLSNLEQLWVSGNGLTGAIPPEFSNLAKLQSLWLHQNQLTGELPEGLAALPLNDIDFSDNQGLCAPPGMAALLGQLSYGPICAYATDKAALAALYHATDGPNWNNATNWLTDAPLSEWHGVAVNRNGRVVGLHLAGNNLTGGIPAELGNLSNIEDLYLDGNNLTGTIPAEVGNLSKLRILGLDGNNLTGELPEGLAALSLREILFFDNAGLCAPQDVAELIQKSYRGPEVIWEYQVQHPDGTITVEIALVPVVGPICAYAADEAALTALYHATDGTNWARVTNWLTDEPLSQWHGVTVNRNGRVTGLNLAQNGLRGTIPTELGNLSELQSLVMSGNDLTGAVPAEIGNLSRLEVIWLNQNNLTGTLPTELVNLSSLTALYIGQNNLSGELPRGLANLPLNTVLFGENPQLCAHASMRSWLESISARGRIC